MLRVLITGSSRGIGRAIAELLGAQGYRLALHYNSGKAEIEQVADTLRERGATIDILQFDISDRDACAQALEKDLAENGAYYGVVHNAGIVRDNAFPAMSGEEWDSVIRTDLDSFYNVLHPLLMPMVRRRKPGRIITLASASGLMGNRGQTNYSAAKGGIIAASKSLALELAKRNITVNCVAPGLIETEMLQGAPIDEALKSVPMKRLGKPEEVAALIGFLLGEQAGYVTRQVISVNGGLF